MLDLCPVPVWVGRKLRVGRWIYSWRVDAGTRGPRVTAVPRPWPAASADGRNLLAGWEWENSDDA
jgi:hypothetical protein